MSVFQPPIHGYSFLKAGFGHKPRIQNLNLVNLPANYSCKHLIGVDRRIFTSPGNMLVWANENEISLVQVACPWRGHVENSQRNALLLRCCYKASCFSFSGVNTKQRKTHTEMIEKGTAHATTVIHP